MCWGVKMSNITRKSWAALHLEDKLKQIEAIANYILEFNQKQAGKMPASLRRKIDNTARHVLRTKKSIKEWMSNVY